MKPHPDILPDIKDPATGFGNRVAILDGLLKGGTVVLPPGTTWIDQQLQLGPVLSNSTLAGSGRCRSILKPVGEAPAAPHTLVVWGEEFGDPGPSGVDAPEGALALPEIPLTGLCYVTGGKTIYDALSGEWRRLSGAPGKATALDRPLCRAYPDVRVCAGWPVANITLRDLTLAQPWHPGAYCLLARRAVNLTLERVRIGQPGDPQSGWGTAECGGLKFLDVDSSSHPLGLNTTHDVVIRGGRYLAVIGEADCADCDLDSVLIATAGQPWQSLYWYLGSDRLRCRNVRIEGGGVVNPAGGTFPPLGVWGRECRLEDVEVAYSQSPPGYGCAFGGDDLQAVNLRSDLLTWVTEGEGVLLRDCAAKEWLLFGGSGRVRDCDGPGLVPEPGWDVDGKRGVVSRVRVADGLIAAVFRMRARRVVVDWGEAKP